MTVASVHVVVLFYHLSDLNQIWKNSSQELESHLFQPYFKIPLFRLAHQLLDPRHHYLIILKVIFDNLNWASKSTGALPFRPLSEEFLKICQRFRKVTSCFDNPQHLKVINYLRVGTVIGMNQRFWSGFLCTCQLLQGIFLLDNTPMNM